MKCTDPALWFKTFLVVKTDKTHGLLTQTSMKK